MCAESTTGTVILGFFNPAFSYSGGGYSYPWVSLLLGALYLGYMGTYPPQYSYTGVHLDGDNWGTLGRCRYTLSGRAGGTLGSGRGGWVAKTLVGPWRVICISSDQVLSSVCFKWSQGAGEASVGILVYL